MIRAQGWKEVAEEALKAVIIATLTGLVGWGIEIAKEKRQKKEAEKATVVQEAS